MKGSSRFIFFFLDILFREMSIICCRGPVSRSQRPRRLRRGSAAALLLGLWARIPPGAWSSVVSVVCCQVDVCEGPIPHLEVSYRGGMSEYDSEASTMRRPWPTRDCHAMGRIGSVSHRLSAFGPTPKFSYPYWPISTFPLL